MFKLIIGLLVVGAIAVIIQDLLSRRNKEAKHADLQDELDDVNEQLIRADVEETVLDAKSTLKSRRATLDKKADDITAPTPPAGKTRKEGDKPSKPIAAKKKATKKAK